MNKKRNNKGQFCKKKWFKIICKMCGKEKMVIPSRRKTAKFCSQKCSQLYHARNNHHRFGRRLPTKIREKISESLYGKFRGEKSYGWAGGRHKSTHGYILVYAPEHPDISKFKKYIYEHRLVAEQTINRYLKPEETIHHINEDKSDNRAENLYLFPNSGAHSRYHHALKRGEVKKITKSNLRNLSKKV